MKKFQNKGHQTGLRLIAPNTINYISEKFLSIRGRSNNKHYFNNILTDFCNSPSQHEAFSFSAGSGLW